MSLFTTFALALVCTYALSVNAALTNAQVETLIAAHNTLRANPTSLGYPPPTSQLPDLKWNLDVANAAQDWTDSCRWARSNNVASTRYGELMYGILEKQFVGNETYWLYEAIRQFAVRGTGFNFEDNTCSSASCSYFTQLYANRTTDFGCGLTLCPAGNVKRYTLVCNYNVYWMWPGVAPYEADTTKGGESSSSQESEGDDSTSASVTASSTSTASATSTADATSGSSSGTGGLSSGGSATTGARTTAATVGGTANSAAATVSSGNAAASPSTLQSIDYRSYASVAPIKDQAGCGSCWAFTAIAVAEGAVGVKYGKTSPLSDQMALDCSDAVGSCSGGWPPDALAGIIAQGGLMLESDYKYTATQGKCIYDPSLSKAKIINSGTTESGSFYDLYTALVTYGPIGIAVKADSAWSSYIGGVLSGDHTDVNHAVTVVGYSASLNAWIVRNQWSKTWGINGYAYLDASHPYAADMYGGFWAVSA